MDFAAEIFCIRVIVVMTARAKKKTHMRKAELGIRSWSSYLALISRLHLRPTLVERDGANEI